MIIDSRTLAHAIYCVGPQFSPNRLFNENQNDPPTYTHTLSLLLLSFSPSRHFSGAQHIAFALLPITGFIVSIPKSTHSRLNSKLGQLATEFHRDAPASCRLPASCSKEASNLDLGVSWVVLCCWICSNLCSTQLSRSRSGSTTRIGAKC
ncbi:hypothetical protein L6452_34242 [Arctium lappa]|uniref:Uncharacterized protein n=1 Tax=Arctium lappa TaxID=4217 RepID=A0ACB8YHS8_ARCLA|nr:hypothetical protein L6452_34242 [Arctium lappa]